MPILQIINEAQPPTFCENNDYLYISFQLFISIYRMFIGDKIYKTSKTKSSRLNQNELTGASYTWYGWIERKNPSKYTLTHHVTQKRKKRNQLLHINLPPPLIILLKRGKKWAPEVVRSNPALCPRSASLWRDERVPSASPSEWSAPGVHLAAPPIGRPPGTAASGGSGHVSLPAGRSGTYCGARTWVGFWGLWWS